MIRTAFRKLFVREQSTIRRRQPSVRLALESLETRITPVVRNVGVGQTYLTIQAGVNAANSGDIVLVQPGTYVEQVTIGFGKNNLILQALNPATAAGGVLNVVAYSIIKCPVVPFDVQGIVQVRGAANVKIDGFEIAGPGTGSSSIESGVLVDNGGSATVTHNWITAIHDFPLGVGLYTQNGVGVSVGATFQRTNTGVFQRGTALIQDNLIDDFQKAGVFADGYNSAAIVKNNTINGIGPNIHIAQFGVGIANLADYDIEFNTITSMSFIAGGRGEGILLFSPASARPGFGVINGNAISSCDVGILGSNSPLAKITNNTITFSRLQGMDLTTIYGATISGNTVVFSGADGIDISGNSFNNAITGNNVVANAQNGLRMAATTHDNTITGNTLVANNTSAVAFFDAVDFSVGFKTGGTANTWSGNTIGTKNNPGLA